MKCLQNSVLQAELSLNFRACTPRIMIDMSGFTLPEDVLSELFGVIFVFTLLIFPGVIFGFDGVGRMRMNRIPVFMEMRAPGDA